MTDGFSGNCLNASGNPDNSIFSKRDQEAEVTAMNTATVDAATMVLSRGLMDKFGTAKIINIIAGGTHL
jgi:hypothetical protein